MKLDKRVSGSGDNGAQAGLAQRLLQQLNPVAIANMSDLEVRDTLPKVVSALQQEGLSRGRPDWWPSNLPWPLHTSPGNVYKSNSSAALRHALLLCHNHVFPRTLGPIAAAHPHVLNWLNSHPPSRSCTQSAKAVLGKPSPKQKGSSMPYLEIYVCYLCNEEFASKDRLQKHQVQCQRGSLSVTIPTTPPASDTPSPDPLTVSSDETSSSGGATRSASPPCSRPGVSHRDFVSALDLVPVLRARKIRQAQRRNTECETIDLEEEPQTPISPSTPRTPKLLISQLSRDASTTGGAGDTHRHSSRRRLSYLRQTSEKKAEGGEEEQGAESDSESDSESSSSSEDADTSKVRKKSLLNIDLTSALGQRVMKHIVSESHMPVIADVEQFCRTPIKDQYQDRLRARQASYPITYKLTRKRLRQQLHCHTYKFTRQDKQDFMDRMRTGLNSECRPLLKQLKKCSVVIRRLSRRTLIKWKPSLNPIRVAVKPLKSEEIQFWTRPKPPSPSVFPSGPTFLHTDVDRVLGLKRKMGVPQGKGCKLAAANFVSEVANAELQLQKLTVYRSLLTDLSSASLSDPDFLPDLRQPHATRNLRAQETRASQYPSLFSILSGEKAPRKPGKARVADFKQPLKIEIPSPSAGPHPSSSQSSALDDTISIKTTTSSDEEVGKEEACCALCAVRTHCTCSPHATDSVSSVHTFQSPGLDSPQCTPPLPALPTSLSSSPGLLAKSSLSSQATLSPPVLSPVSQLSSSPTCSRLTRSSAAHSPLPSPLSQYSCPSPGPTLCSAPYSPELPVPCSRQLSSRSKTVLGRMGTTAPGQDEDREDRDVQRRSTRSNPSDRGPATYVSPSLTPKSSPGLPKQEALGGKPAPLLGSLFGAVKEEGSGLPGTDKRSTRSGRVFGEMSGEADRKSLHKSSRSSRSGSRSSERSSAADSASLDGVGWGAVRVLRSGSSVGSASPHSDSTVSVQTQARGQLSGKDPVSVDSNSRVDNRTNVGLNGGRSCTRTSARNHLSGTGSLEALAVSHDGDIKTESMCDGDAVSSALSQRPAHGTSSGRSQAANPFLLSKEQTPLFSSTVREQARRLWHTSHKSPDRLAGGKAVLRSGTSFRRPSNHSPPTTPAATGQPSPTRTGKKQHVSCSSGLLVPATRDDGSRLSSHTVPPTETITCGADHATSPVRKRLSPLQMLSVLESAKSRQPRRKAATKRPAQDDSKSATAPAYPTRTKEAAGGPVKKPRSAHRVE